MSPKRHLIESNLLFLTVFFNKIITGFVKVKEMSIKKSVISTQFISQPNRPFYFKENNIGGHKNGGFFDVVNFPKVHVFHFLDPLQI